MNVHLISTVEERFNFILYWIFIIDYLFYNNMFPNFRKLHGMCSKCAMLKMENKNSLTCATKTQIKQSKQTEKPLLFLISFFPFMELTFSPRTDLASQTGDSGNTWSPGHGPHTVSLSLRQSGSEAGSEYSTLETLLRRASRLLLNPQIPAPCSV